MYKLKSSTYSTALQYMSINGLLINPGNMVRYKNNIPLVRNSLIEHFCGTKAN